MMIFVSNWRWPALSIGAVLCATEVGKENMAKQETRFSPGNLSLNLSTTTGFSRFFILGETT